MEEFKIKSFTDLETWKQAHKLVILIYKIVDIHFPESEKFGLSSQIKRAVVSISSNIAEGFNRNTSKDKKHFYNIAQGSLTEIQNQLLISKDLNFITEEIFYSLSEQLVIVAKLLSGLKKSVKDYQP